MSNAFKFFYLGGHNFHFHAANIDDVDDDANDVSVDANYLNDSDQMKMVDYIFQNLTIDLWQHVVEFALEDEKNKRGLACHCTDVYIVHHLIPMLRLLNTIENTISLLIFVKYHKIYEIG